jgi:predicted Ser/Thr protein kinase
MQSKLTSAHSAQLLEANLVLHALGVVHGDLHMNNVVIDDKQRVRLIDLDSAHRITPKMNKAIVAAMIASDWKSLCGGLYELIMHSWKPSNMDKSLDLLNALETTRTDEQALHLLDMIQPISSTSSPSINTTIQTKGRRRRNPRR